MSFKNQEKRKAVTFSYDDGVTQDVRLIELLNQYGLKCTFNINSELFGRRGIGSYGEQRIACYRLQAEDVKFVYDGHEVAVHTLTHSNLTKLSETEIIHQVEQDRLNLSELVGYEVVGMAYPCGGVNNDDRVAEIVKNSTGVKYARTTTCNERFDLQHNLYRFNPTVFHLLEFDRLMEIAKNFVELQTDQPQIFYIWGHSYEMDYHADNWRKLEEFFEYISRRDDIFYGTNTEVLL